MIYSRWRPDKGGYDYFESRERLGLGDDLPVPSLPVGTRLGVPSTEVGRPSPSGLRRIGSGEHARGSLLPISRSAMSGLDIPLSTPWILIAAAAAGVGFAMGRRR